MARGSVWVRNESDKLSYAAFVTNGPTANVIVSGHPVKFDIGDNNSDKMVGGRISYYMDLGDFGSMTLGGNVTSAKYDVRSKLRVNYYGADLEINYQNRLKFQARGYWSPREISGTIAGTGATTTKVADLYGVFVRLEASFAEKWSLSVETDWLMQEAPLMGPGGTFNPAQLQDIRNKTVRYEVAGKYQFHSNARLSLAYGLFDRESDLLKKKDIGYVSAGVLFFF